MDKRSSAFTEKKLRMWFSSLLSESKGAQYLKRFLHNKGFGDLFKGKKTGHTSDSTVKDSSGYDFLWTIKSFSKLPVGNESKQISGKFEAKGYSWKLILYPNGKIVNGQISLYLKLLRTASHTTESVFKVSYELFLFNRNTGSTLSKKGENLVQVQVEMGFRNLIDLKTFKDPSNGYLLNESCMFGVKILQVVPIKTNTECLQPVEKISHDHTWKIENFSKSDRKNEKFTAGDYLWSIDIYADMSHKSDIKGKGKSLSLHLFYNGSMYDGSDTKVSTEFSLTIIDQIGGNHKKMTNTEVFKCDHGWGWKDFIPLKDFNDPTKGFLVDDTCIIKASVAVIGLVN